MLIRGSSASAGTEVATVNKDGQELLKVAQDYGDLLMPSVPILNQVTADATEGPTNASGTAQAGAASSITLAAGASAVTDYYKYMRIYLVGGTGSGQNRLCSAYNGTTKQWTPDTNFSPAPNATTQYEIYLDCHWKEFIRLYCSFSVPSQDGAFMKSKLLVKLFDVNRKMVLGKIIEPMSIPRHTYAVTGNYLSPMPCHLDTDSRVISETIDLPVRGAKNFRIYLDGGVYQCNTWSAPVNRNTIATSGNVTVYATGV